MSAPLYNYGFLQNNAYTCTKEVPIIGKQVLHRVLLILGKVPTYERKTLLAVLSFEFIIQ